MTDEKRIWQIKMFEIAKELNHLIEQYEIRKLKFIKYVPTDKEISNAVEMYKYLLEDAEKGEESSIKMLEILNDLSENTEEQIKMFGFMDETLTKYSDGKVPKDVILDIAEKWDVLDYIVEDIAAILGIKFREELKKDDEYE